MSIRLGEVLWIGWIEGLISRPSSYHGPRKTFSLQLLLKVVLHPLSLQATGIERQTRSFFGMSKQSRTPQS